MKNVVIFFLLLCVHLAGAHSYAHASAHNEKVYFSPARDFKKTHYAESAIAGHNCLLTNTSSLGENSNLIDLEDEDQNEEIIRKHISQAKYFLACCYAFISNHRFSFLADPLPCCQHLSYSSSCKYIIQRTLRI